MSSSAGGTEAPQVRVLGEIPEGWISKPLRDLVTLSSESGVPSEGPDLPVVGMEHVESETGRVLGVGVSSDFRSSSFMVRPGQVLYGRLRPYLNKVFMPLEHCYTSREFIPMNASAELLSDFLAHRLRAQDFVQFAVSLNAGDRPRVKWLQIADHAILVPPLEEQRVIVDVLEGQFSFLDAALESVRRSRVEAVRLRRALLRDAFSGVLTHPDLPPGETPEGWSTSCLGELVKFAPKPSASLVASGVEVSYVPMAKVSEVSGEIQCDETISVTQGKKRSLTYFEDGDVIFAKITPCMENGKSAVAKGLLNGAAFGSSEFHVMRVSPQLLPSYLWFVLVHDDFRYLAERSMTGAVGQRRVPRSFIEDYALSVPPLEEQHEIVELLERELGLLDLAMKAADRIEIQAKSLRRSLLHSAFNGELTREWRENHG